MVVPSRYEPFGIVALEGIACGCVVVASDADGLPDAVGNCGLIFRSEDITDLVRALRQALLDDALKMRLRVQRQQHLARFARAVVAHRYLEVIKSAAIRSGAI